MKSKNVFSQDTLNRYQKLKTIFGKPKAKNFIVLKAVEECLEYENSEEQRPTLYLSGQTETFIKCYQSL